MSSLMGQLDFLTRSNFSAGTASWRGAGFVFQNSTGTVTDSNAFGNKVSHHHGAGVSIEYHSKINLTRVNIHDNVNDGRNNWRYGAGINIDFATVFMKHVNIYNNILTGSCGSDAQREICEGGGMYVGGHGGASRASSVYMEDCIVNNNTARSYAEGGGIFVVDSELTMVRCNISGNSALGERDEGGGIYVGGSSSLLMMTDCEVLNNTAGSGGGIFGTGGAKVSLDNVRMAENVATDGDGSDSISVSGGSGSFPSACDDGDCYSKTECIPCGPTIGPLTVRQDGYDHYCKSLGTDDDVSVDSEHRDCNKVKYARRLSLAEGAGWRCYEALSSTIERGAYCSGNEICAAGSTASSYCTRDIPVLAPPKSSAQHEMDRYCRNLGVDDEVTVPGEHENCKEMRYARRTSVTGTIIWRCYANVIAKKIGEYCAGEVADTYANCSAGNDNGRAYCTRTRELAAIAEYGMTTTGATAFSTTAGITTTTTV